MVFGHILNCSIQSKNIFIFILICFWIQKTKNYQRKHFHKKIPKFVTLWTRPNTPFFTKNYKFVQKIKNCPNNEEKNRPKDPIWKGKVSKLFVKIEHAFISCCTNKINFWRKAFFQSETYQIRFTFWINTKNFDWFWNFQEKTFKTNQNFLCWFKMWIWSGRFLTGKMPSSKNWFCLCNKI